MIKKLTIFLCSLMPLMASASLAVGTWNLHAPFNKIDKMVETKGMVYYMSSGTLYSIDKETDEVATLNSATKLNDNSITNIYHNPKGGYLLVAYTTGNMDKLYDDGKIVNLPDISASVMNVDRTINDVSFGEENFYVSTAFGLVVYDDKRNSVVSTIYRDGGFTCSSEIGKYLLICDGKLVYTADRSSKLLNFNQFTNQPINGSTSNTRWLKFIRIADDTVAGIINWNNGELYKLTLNSDGSLGCTSYKVASGSKNFNGVTDMYALPNGGAQAYNSTEIITIATDGSSTNVILPELLKGQVISSAYGFSDLWAGDKNGVALYDASNPSSIVEKKGKVGKGEYCVKNVNNLILSPTNKIYVSNCYSKMQIPHYTHGIDDSRLTINIIDNGEILNITPDSENVKVYHKGNPIKDVISHNFIAVEDPNNQDAYYVGTWYDGIYRIEKDQSTGEYVETHNYFHDNSTLQTASSNWAVIVCNIAFDANDNLWAYCFTSDNLPALHMLSKEGRMKNATTKADWVSIDVPELLGSRNTMIVPTPDKKKFYIAKGSWSSEIVVYDTKGTTNTSDDTYSVWKSYIDQDGKSLNFNHIGSLLLDKNGHLWVGTDSGVFEITNLNQTNTDSPLVNHIKVPRNDGTNLADYLLDAQSVLSMACDSSNRKWLTTSTSGVYLVSESGDEIIENFTKDNSSLPDNLVHSVVCDPYSNSVYFGTDYGMLEYSSSSAPASPDYGEIYAYPNPVRPDYGGWITVKGLMDNSLVKIMDAAGNLVAMGRSDAGMFVWDGCNTEGNRVKTGVYYVYASQNDNGTSSGTVTKIMVVN